MASSGEQYYSVNIEEILTDYTWKRFRMTKPFLRRPFLRKQNYYVDINWGYIDFKHETISFDVRPDSASTLLAEIASPGSSESPPSPSKQQSVAKDGSKNVVLYQSRYENRTPLDQQYTFTTTRETTASCTIEFQETYTKGAECNIELALPGDIVTIGAGLSGELSVTETKSESFEEKMSWEVNTQINVPKFHTAEATVFVSERNSMADFEVKTTMSLPDGKDMPISVRRRCDDVVVYTDIFNDFEHAFKVVANKFPNVELVDSKDEKRGMLRSNVVLTTFGTCKSISWKNQFVQVNSKKVEGKEGTETPPATDGQ